jgi:acyl-CoA thioester hydrolase
VQLSYRGSVNRWECDENDHLNVRFYVDKHWQTLCGGVDLLGVQPRVNFEELQQRLSVQHLRFLQESRLAAPLSGYAGVVAQTADHIDVLTELRQSYTDEPMSTCVHRLTGLQANVVDELPTYAEPRGVVDKDLTHSKLPLLEVDGYGFKVIGAGVIQSDECGSNGLPRIYQYMGRISDSMPHLWGLLHAEAGEMDDNEGGAVLEYRLRYHRPLNLGERFVVMSGIGSVGEKVQQFAHLLFNADDGAICVSAQAAGVRMDLIERRAKVLTEEMQSQMRARQIREISV